MSHLLHIHMQKHNFQLRSFSPEVSSDSFLYNKSGSTAPVRPLPPVLRLNNDLDTFRFIPHFSLGYDPHLNVS